MGFIRDLFEWIGNTVIQIISGIINFFTTWIQWMDKTIRIAMHDTIEWISSVMSNWVGGVVVLLLFFLAIVAGPYILAVAKSTGFIAMYESIALVIKQGVDWILITVHWRELMMINDILQILWTEWKDMFVDFYEAIASLNEGLGYGFGFMELALRNARTVMQNAGMLVGIPKEYVELEYVEQAANNIRHANNHFDRYVKEPDKWLKSLDEQVTYPYYDLAANTQNEILTSIAGLLTTTKEKFEQFNTLKESFEKMVDDLPPKMTAAIRQWYDPLVAQYNAFYEDEYLIWKDKIERATVVYDNYLAEVREDNKKAKLRLDRPVTNIFLTQYLNPEYWAEEIRLLGCLAWQGLQEAYKYASQGVSWAWEKLMEDAQKIYIPPPAPTILTFEPDTVGLKELQPVKLNKTWNVGEY